MTDAEHAAFLRHLRPERSIQAEVEDYAKTHFAGHPIVAVHVRHGNGGDLMHYAKHWTNESGAIEGPRPYRACPRCARPASARLPLHRRSSDRGRASRSCAGAPHARQGFRPAGAGSFHDGHLAAEGDGETVGRGALIEMLLLARGDALVCYPPYSLFSSYARMCGRAAIF